MSCLWTAVSIACFILISTQSAPAEAWRERLPEKWAPQYTPNTIMYPRYTSSLGSLSSTGAGYGFRKPYVNPSWFIESMNPIYKRQKVIRRQSTCVPEGDICLFRGGLMGAAVKRTCCENASCIFVGKSFTCVSQSTMENFKEQITRELDEDLSDEYDEE